MIKKILKYIVYLFKFGRKVSFPFNVNIGLNSRFEGCNKIGKDSIFSGYMGFGTYISHHSIIYGHIGKFTSIATNCNTLIGRHPITIPYVSTSPMFYSLLKQNGTTFTKTQLYIENNLADKINNYPIVIGNDCWIGFGVSIVEGVKIGDGAVIQAQSLVTKDVPAYAIMGGIPAKIIKYRYDESTISALMKIQWWNKDIKWIKDHSSFFCDMKKFLDLFNVEL